MDPAMAASPRAPQPMGSLMDVLSFLLLATWLIVKAVYRACLPSTYTFRKDVAGEVALVTGGGGGLGRLMALRLAKLGATVVLWDVNVEGVEETVGLVKGLGGKAYGFKCDLADKEDVYRVAKKTQEEVGNVNILINNAGVVSGQLLLNTPDHLIKRTFDVNVISHFWTVKAFLPKMIEADHGHIVTIASMAGHIGVTKLVDYCASKYAAVGFDEALKVELEQQGVRGVKTTVVCPYFIRQTGMFDNVSSRFLPSLRSNDVADRVVKAILREENAVAIPGVFAGLGILKVKIEEYWKWTRRVAFKASTEIAQLTILCFLAVYYVAESLVYAVTPSFLLSEKSLRGKIVLVTGGAGGLGQDLVLRMARQDAKVVVWDYNEEALAILRKRAKDEGHLIYTYPVDVTEKEMVYKYAKLVKEDVGPVDILINNAGVVCGQTLLDIPDYMVEKTFKVNILAHFWTVKAFLPDMMKRRQGHIVTVGSLTGLLGTYKCTDYSASKFATVGLHESLITELKTHGHHKIKMTLICPYFIDTGMFDGCKPKNLPMLQPREVAKRIITAVKREEEFVTMPAYARYIFPLKNFLPAKLSWALMIRVIQGPQTMMSMRTFKEVEAA